MTTCDDPPPTTTTRLPQNTLSNTSHHQMLKHRVNMQVCMKRSMGMVVSTRHRHRHLMINLTTSTHQVAVIILRVCNRRCTIHPQIVVILRLLVCDLHLRVLWAMHRLFDLLKIIFPLVQVGSDQSTFVYLPVYLSIYLSIYQPCTSSIY